MINLILALIINVNAELVCKEVQKPKECATCCPKIKPKIITKTVEVERIVNVTEVKRIIRKNNLTLLGGIGPKGNLREDAIVNGYQYFTDNGFILGLNYTRNLVEFQDTALTGSIQVQTNRSALLGIGLEF